MALVVLVLWLFTAGVGFYLLVTSNLGRARPAQSPPFLVSPPVGVAPSGSAPAAAGPAPRAARDQFAPASLVASRQASIVPDLRSLAEFAHPACGISGLGFWLGFTLVHYRVLGWIAFGLIAATACIGLAWFTANTRAARRDRAGQPAPSFTSRLILLHGGAAAVTLTLAALTALVIQG
jgi:hypothetical protein